MLQFINSGGGLMWILIVIALVILLLTVKNIITILKRDGRPIQEINHSINAILFWGILSAVYGLFLHFMGIYLAMQAIAQASDISPAIVAMGYSHSLVSILTGMFILLMSGIFWFGLRQMQQRVATG